MFNIKLSMKVIHIVLGLLLLTIALSDKTGVDVSGHRLKQHRLPK
jgi:hypothetical protein